MVIKSVPIYNPQNPPHLKPKWVVKVGFKWVWDGMRKTDKDTGTGMGIGLTTPNPPHTCIHLLGC